MSKEGENAYRIVLAKQTDCNVVPLFQFHDDSFIILPYPKNLHRRYLPVFHDKRLGYTGDIR